MAKQEYENKMIDSVLNYEPNKVSTRKLIEQKKTKRYLLKVYPKTWEAFTTINRQKGLSNSAVLNLLIHKYIKKGGKNFG
jgi:hypothetical protein